MNILLDHYMLTHDKDQHAAEISDFFIFEFKKEKSTYYMFLIFTTHTGKQNQCKGGTPLLLYGASISPAP